MHAIPAQNLRDYFAPETQFKSSELVEVAEDYLIVKKQGQLVLIPEDQIAMVIISWLVSQCLSLDWSDVHKKQPIQDWLLFLILFTIWCVTKYQ